MVEEKNWYQSKTVLGGWIAIVASLAGLFGYFIDVDTQNQLVDVLIMLASAVGGMLSIYGRIRASKKVV